MGQFGQKKRPCAQCCLVQSELHHFATPLSIAMPPPPKIRSIAGPVGRPGDPLFPPPRQTRASLKARWIQTNPNRSKAIPSTSEERARVRSSNKNQPCLLPKFASFCAFCGVPHRPDDQNQPNATERRNYWAMSACFSLFLGGEGQGEVEQ